MKAKLTFDLDDMDDRMAHLRAVKSLDMAIVLWEIVHNMKKGLEHEIGVFENYSANDAIDLIYSKINDLLDEHGVVIDKLII